jgi:arylsulfatase A-like enzyme
MLIYPRTHANESGEKPIPGPTVSRRLAFAPAMRCIRLLGTCLRLMGLSMHPDRSIAAGEALQPKARATAGELQSLRTAPATILVVAIWIGLTAGFLDLGLMILKKRLTGDDFYRLSDHFRWIIPAGVGVLTLLPGTALAMVARLRRGTVPLGPAVGLLSFVGFLDSCSRLPLELWSSLLLSGGLAVQSARLVGGRREPFVRMVRRTSPLLVGALLAILLLSVGGRAWSEYRARATVPPPPANARNVLLIVWDTVRAGNLSLYGYGRRTSPNLEQLAGWGVRFDQAFATASWTLPSHGSLFTGRWPHELTADWQSPLDETPATLAEYLGANGYDTAGFVANLDYCSRETGLSRGFAHYEDYPVDLWEIFTRYIGMGSRIDLLTPASVINRLLKRYWGDTYDVIPRSKEHAKDAATVDRSFLAWLSWQRTRDRPFFAFLNYNDAHSPYEVPDRLTPAFGLRPISYLDRLILKNWDTLDKTKLSYHHVQMAIDVYDDSISYLDRRLGILLGELRRRGVLDDTLLVLAADHGEHLGDHLLFFHGCSLYRQVVGVPLVIVDPKGVPAGRVVAEPVSLRDIPATVADLLGLPRGTPFPGRSLARLWAGNEPAKAPADEPLLMEIGRPLVLMNQGREPVAKGPMKALVAEGMHYIRSADGLEELYLLKSDSQEQNNLAMYSFASESLQRFRARMQAMVKKR